MLSGAKNNMWMMRWTRKKVNRMGSMEQWRELIPQVRWGISKQIGWWFVMRKIYRWSSKRRQKYVQNRSGSDGHDFFQTWEGCSRKTCSSQGLSGQWRQCCCRGQRCQTMQKYVHPLTVTPSALMLVTRWIPGSDGGCSSSARWRPRA